MGTLAIFPIDVSRIATLGLREKAEGLVRAGRDRGLSIDAVFTAGRELFWWPNQREAPDWPPFNCEGDSILARHFRYERMYRQLRRVAFNAGKYSCFWLREMPAGPAQLLLLREAHNRGLRVVLDVPTYPHPNAQAGAPQKLAKLLVQGLAHLRARYVDRVATLSTHQEIWGVPTVRVRNGIAPVQETRGKLSARQGKLHVIGLGQWAPVHGIERLFEAVAKAQLTSAFRFTLAGVGPSVATLETLAIALGLDVTWLPSLGGRERAELLASADVGVGALGHAGNAVELLFPLKHRLYAAYGLPFLGSHRDPDFAGVDGVYTVTSDTELLNAAAILAFADAARTHRAQWGKVLRARAKQLSWSHTYEPLWSYLAATTS